MSLEKCVKEDISSVNKVVYNKDLYTLIEEKIEGQFVNYCIEEYGPDYENILKEKNVTKITVLNEMGISVIKEINKIAKKAVGLATPFAYLKGWYNEVVDMNFDVINYLLPKIKISMLEDVEDVKYRYNNEYRMISMARSYKSIPHNGGLASSSKKIVRAIKKYFNPSLTHYKQQMQQ